MKTKLSTIAAAIGTIAAIATIGSIGGAGQQLALAQEDLDLDAFFDEIDDVVEREVCPPDIDPPPIGFPTPIGCLEETSELQDDLGDVLCRHDLGFCP